MVVDLISFIIMWLNAFPLSSGIQAMSPRTIVVGTNLSYTEHCRCPFGAYVQKHEDGTNKTDRPQTLDAICLGPTGNAQGTYKFLNLATGKRIYRRKWTEIPASDWVIQRVNDLGRRDKAEQELVFRNLRKEVIRDDVNDNNVANLQSLSDSDDNDDTLDDDIIAPDITDDARHGLLDEGVRRDDVDDHGNDAQDIQEQDVQDTRNNILTRAKTTETKINAQPTPIIVNNNINPTLAEIVNRTLDERREQQTYADVVQERVPVMERQEPGNVQTASRSPRVKLEPNIRTETITQDDRQIDEIRNEPELLDDNHQLEAHSNNDGENHPEEEMSVIDAGGVEIDDIDEYHPDTLTPSQASVVRPRSPIRTRSWSKQSVDDATLIHYALTQLTLKEGLKRFGEKGEAAVTKEIKQLHDRDVFTPVHRNTLTDKQKREALKLLMCLKEKRNKDVKGRGCADGRKQRNHYDKDEATSPTVALESVLLTSVIDAHERRDVAVVDIPGAFLQTDMDDDVCVSFDGSLAELMVKALPEIYSKYVTVNNKGNKVLYVKLKKALYGCLKSAILFYRKLAADLTKMGFKINFYDPCVANKLVGVKQLTVCWHVDDLKISHVNKHVVTKLIRKLNRLYGKTDKLTVSRGKYHDYLGMYLDH